MTNDNIGGRRGEYFRTSEFLRFGINFVSSTRAHAQGTHLRKDQDSGRLGGSNSFM